MTLRRGIFILLLGAAAWAAGAQSPVPLRRFAMVAGSNNGGDSLVRLKYAETDARSFAAVMQDLVAFAVDWHRGPDGGAA